MYETRVNSIILGMKYICTHTFSLCWFTNNRIYGYHFRVDSILWYFYFRSTSCIACSIGETEKFSLIFITLIFLRNQNNARSKFGLCFLLPLYLRGFVNISKNLYYSRMLGFSISQVVNRMVRMIPDMECSSFCL